MNKRIVIGLLVMLSLLVSGFTYAYWVTTEYTAVEETSSVTIGQGYTATVSAAINGDATGVTLVPANQSANSVSTSPVEYFVFSYNVTLADDRDGLQSGTLAATVSNVQIGGETTYISLVLTVVQVGGDAPVNGVMGTANTTITEGTATVVYVKVTLTEPGTLEIYNAIKNAAITFDVDFAVTPA